MTVPGAKTGALVDDDDTVWLLLTVDVSLVSSLGLGLSWMRNIHATIKEKIHVLLIALCHDFVELRQSSLFILRTDGAPSGPEG